MISSSGTFQNKSKLITRRMFILSSIKIIDKKSNKISDSIINKYFKIDNKFKLKKEINKLVVCTGPGSYTALRVGITFMYGLSYAKNISLIGLSCLELIKFSLSKSEFKKTLFIICSSNSQNYASFFSKEQKKKIKNVVIMEIINLKIKIYVILI